MNYIDELAKAIYDKVDKSGDPFQWHGSLYRLYALLGLILGADVDLVDVHDAWSVWTAHYQPDHPSLVPFDQLSTEVQELDRPYAEAIREAIQEWYNDD